MSANDRKYYCHFKHVTYNDIHFHQQITKYTKEANGGVQMRVLSFQPLGYFYSQFTQVIVKKHVSHAHKPQDVHFSQSSRIAEDHGIKQTQHLLLLFFDLG